MLPARPGAGGGHAADQRDAPARQECRSSAEAGVAAEPALARASEEPQSYERGVCTRSLAPRKAVVGLLSRRDSLGIAARRYYQSPRPYEPVLEAFLTLPGGGGFMPGYGWVFFMPDGILNVGAGLLSTFKQFQGVWSGQLPGRVQA